MVIARNTWHRCRGALSTELVVAIAILAGALMPVSFGFLQEIRLARILYQDAVAMQILDGEMEVLAAGEWRAFPEGEHELRARAGAAENLPPGKFTVIRTRDQIEIVWEPTKHGRRMTRAVRLP